MYQQPWSGVRSTTDFYTFKLNLYSPRSTLQTINLKRAISPGKGNKISMFSKLFLATLALQFLYVFGVPNQHISYDCPLTSENTTSLMKLPAAFPKPTSDLSYVAVALGTQNYTCSGAGTYTYVSPCSLFFARLMDLINKKLI
jgi:hypothetical protein